MDPLADLRRIVGLRRFENGVAASVTARLAEARDLIVADLVRWNPADFAGAERRARLQRVQTHVDGILADAFRGSLRTTHRDLRGLTAVINRAVLRDLRATVGPDLVHGGMFSAERARIIAERSMIQGWPLERWWGAQEVSTSQAFQRQMRAGLSQGETVDQLVRRVRGSSAGGGRYVGGIMQTTTRQAETLVRTAVMGVSNSATMETLKTQTDITTKYTFVTALDDRVCLQCGPLDGETYAYGKGPQPPLHPRCRCTLTPVVDWAGLGIDPPEGGERAAQHGPVSSATTYSDWLRAQPASVQDEILGRTRAAWFREGRIGLDRLVTGEGRTYTLDELEERL